MIYTNGLMSSIDSLFNSNMFLKDENKVNNLKGQIVSVFSEISADTASLNSQINYNTGRINELEREYRENHDAIVAYLRENIEACKHYLNALGEWY